MNVTCRHAECNRRLPPTVAARTTSTMKQNQKKKNCVEYDGTESINVRTVKVNKLNCHRMMNYFSSDQFSAQLIEFHYFWSLHIQSESIHAAIGLEEWCICAGNIIACVKFLGEFNLDLALVVVAFPIVYYQSVFIGKAGKMQFIFIFWVVLLLLLPLLLLPLLLLL